MKTKTKTRVQKMREDYAYNQAYIQRTVELTEFEFHEIEFESGCEFLEKLYPIGTNLNVYYKILAYDAAFWTWFRHEWMLWSAVVVGAHKNTCSKMPVNWLNILKNFGDDKELENNFYDNFWKVTEHKKFKIPSENG